MIRTDNNDEIYRTRDEKWDAICKEVLSACNKGQPVLVGTTNIETSELISKKLRKFKINHQVLNARYHERSKYNCTSRKTICCYNSYKYGWEGTDIQLGGNLDEQKNRIKNI